MKLLQLSILFFILSFSPIEAQVDYPVAIRDSLSKVLNKIQKNHGVLFSYDDQLISKKEISFKNGSYTLSQIIEIISKKSKLKFDFIDGKHILISSNTKQLTSICGYLKDKLSGKGVAYANVFARNKSIGTITDTSGYFFLKITEGQELFTASFLGYEDIHIYSGDHQTEDCPDYYFKLGSISFQPVILREYLTDGVRQSSLGNTIIIDPQELSTLPGSVDKDILASIQFLPGISSPNESLNNIHIRGGTPDQNLILWDDIPIFHTSHLFGTISAFNPFVIDHVNVYRSGIGSEYGGRVSGVIDMRTDEEVNTKFKGSTGFNLTHLYLNLDIPLWKNSSLQLSTRRSITDAWSTPTFVSYAKKVFQGTKAEDNDFNQNLPFSDEFKFNDGHLKWLYKTGNNTFTISSIGALNSLNFTNEIPAFDAFSTDALELDNRGFKMGWKRNWSDRLSTSVDAITSVYNYDYRLFFQVVDSMGDPPIQFDSKNRIQDGSFKIQLDYKVDETQKLKAGFDFKENLINLTIKQKNQDRLSEEIQSFTNRLASIFGDYTLQLPGVLKLDLGLRYQNHVIIKKNYFEPRIALVADLKEHLKLKASTGKHFQFISQLAFLDINDLGFSNQIWVASNDTSIPVIESNQWMVGIMYQKDAWTIDLEGYVKELGGITTLTSGFAGIENQPFSQGDSRIRGLDLLVKRRIGKYRSWLSYTLSKTLYEFGNISQEAFRASHDRRHFLQWVNLYKKKQWEYSLGFSLGSPLPYTPAGEITSMEDNLGNTRYKIQFDKINSAELENYFRMDASIVYNYSMTDRYKGFISFSIQNIGDKRNLLGRQFILSNNRPMREPNILSNNELGLGFTPNLSVHLEW